MKKKLLAIFGALLLVGVGCNDIDNELNNKLLEQQQIIDNLNQQNTELKNKIPSSTSGLLPTERTQQPKQTILKQSVVKLEDNSAINIEKSPNEYRNKAEMDAVIEKDLNECCVVPYSEMAVYDINIRNTGENVIKDNKWLDQSHSFFIEEDCKNAFTELKNAVQNDIIKQGQARDTTMILKAMKEEVNTQAQNYIAKLANDVYTDQATLNSFVLESSSKLKAYTAYNRQILQTAVEADQYMQVKQRIFSSCAGV